MRENLTEVLTGGAVLAVALGFLAWTAASTGAAARTDGYDLVASFRSAEGVREGTDVRLAGVKVGTVTDIALDPETYRARTVLTLADEVRIPLDSSAAVASEGLLGGTFVEIVPGGSFDYLAPGASFETTQGAVSLVSLLLAFVGAEE